MERGSNSWTYDEVRWEANIEWQYTLEFLDMLVTQRNIQRFEVGNEVLDFSTADDRENVWGFLHDIRDGD